MSQNAGDHTVWQELLAGHALNALDPAEEAELLAHLSGCADCRAELDQYALTAAHLAALADDESDTAPGWSEIRGGLFAGDTPVISLDSHRHRRVRVSQRLLAAAAGVVVIAGAAVVGSQVVGSSKGGAHDVALASCVTTQPCSAIPLRSTDGVHRATVVVINGVARLQPVAMSQPAHGRTYVLWQLPRGRAPIPLTEFVSASATSGSSPLSVPLSQTTAFAVSSERADVHPTSPTRVVAIGSV
ncbi:MAG TPA: anti-sigma factor [Mycobacteriales bacterium]|nr:anti-sigma factor [Mycobacteriales bacterium]